jgi:hypothetical protein
MKLLGIGTEVSGGVVLNIVNSRTDGPGVVVKFTDEKGRTKNVTYTLAEVESSLE